MLLSARARNGSSPRSMEGRYVPHQGIEGLSPFHEACGEHQLGVLLILYPDRDVVLGEHISGAKAQLQGVAQVDRDGQGCIVPGGAGVIDGRTSGQGPSGTGRDAPPRGGRRCRLPPPAAC